MSLPRGARLPPASQDNHGIQLQRQAPGGPGRHVPAGPAYLVGLGASAGGLAALRTLFAGLKEVKRLSFVLAQHLAARQIRPGLRAAILTGLKQDHVERAARKADVALFFRPGDMHAIEAHVEAVTAQA